MNVKLHTPKSLKAGSGLSSLKQFVLSLVATTISIVLTFGTAAVIDHKKKEAEKHEMVMTVLYDFDRSIAALEKADTVFREAVRLQQEVALHPEWYDSLRYQFIPVGVVSQTIFQRLLKGFSHLISRRSTPLATSTSSARCPISIFSAKTTRNMSLMG